MFDIAAAYESSRSENIRLRAQLAAVHDHLHAGRINEAHEACHCDGVKDESKPLPNQNIPIGVASKLQQFAGWFNREAEALDLPVCWVGLIPSATKVGYTSIQIGGNVDVIQQVRRMMGRGPTQAVGDHNKTGRNDLCPCGSGKKFKKCCLK